MATNPEKVVCVCVYGPGAMITDDGELMALSYSPLHSSTQWVADFAKAGASNFTFHLEAVSGMPPTVLGRVRVTRAVIPHAALHLQPVYTGHLHDTPTCRF